MASTDAIPIPKKNVAYRVSFPIFDADGDLVSGAATLDSEISKDGGTFADVTAEATEIATSSGMYFLDLTATEMDADTVAIIVKTSTAGAKTTPIVLYPEEAGDIRCDVTQLGGVTQSLTDLKDFADDGYNPATNKVTGVLLVDTTTTNTDLVTAAVIADAVLNEDMTAHQTQGSLGQAIGDPGADATTIYQSVATDAAGDNIAVDIVAVKAETVLIVADTNELQTDDIPGAIAALNDIAAGDVWAVDATTQQTQGTFGQAIGDPVADTTTIYQSVATDATGDNVAVDVVAMKAETTLIVADTDELQTDDVPGLIAALNDPTAAVIADAVWDEALSGHVAGGSAGKTLLNAAGFIVADGTAQAGAASTITLESGESATDDFFKFNRIVLDGGTGVGQSRIITKYVGSTKVATVDAAWFTNPDATSTYIIEPASVHAATSIAGYQDGAIWIDTVNGVAGTVDFVNGVANNPVLTLADALTLATSLGLSRFIVVNGSTITLTGNSDNFTFLGRSWNLALGGQSIDGLYVIGATISGIGTGATQPPRFEISLVGTSTLPACDMLDCCFTGTITSNQIGDYVWHSCHSASSTAAPPIFDFGAALGNTHLHLRNYAGSMDIRNMGQTGTDEMSMEGDGELIINANCIGGTVELRGAIELTDGGSGQTITQDARLTTPKIADEVWDEATAGHTTSGTFGEQCKTDIDAILVDTTLIVADTNELQTDDVPGLIAALNDIAAGDVWAVDATTQQTQGTFGQAIGDPVADTTTIFQSVATDATGDNIAVDVVAVKAETVLIVADTNELQVDWTDGGRLDLLIDAILDDTGTSGVVLQGTPSVNTVQIDSVAVAAQDLALSAQTIVQGTVDTTGFASTTTEFESDDITEATADHYNGRVVIFTSDILQDQATDITDYSLATGRGHFTVTALTEAPPNNATFVIV
jgi:hypothetical protein